MVKKPNGNVELEASLNGAGSAQAAREVPRIGSVLSTGDEESSLERRSRFSLFKWFRRGSSISRGHSVEVADVKAAVEGVDRSQGSVCSSNDSVDTLCSTTTVRSFAFHAGAPSHLQGLDGFSLGLVSQGGEVGPFAPGASKVLGKNGIESCNTLPNVNSGRGDIGTRYSLQTYSFNSCGSLARVREPRRADTDTGSRGRRVHVKGKRRAPNPPIPRSRNPVNVEVSTRNRGSARRKRPAPPPPDRNSTTSQGSPEDKKFNTSDMADLFKDDKLPSISNDTLVLKGGVLLSKREARSPSLQDSSASSSIEKTQGNKATATPRNGAMLRPWYKRSVFEHSRDPGINRRGDILRSPTNLEQVATSKTSSSRPQEKTSSDSTLSRLNFFHRDRQTEERRREAKRKSGLSILANISELDKEAAAIVQEEQARARASMLLQCAKFSEQEKRPDNQEVVQELVTSAMESSPRRGTRALISKFNAISNITKVTVNTSFFSKTGQEDSKTEGAPGERQDDWRCRYPLSSSPGRTSRVDRDLSRYFLPQPRTPKNETPNLEEKKKITEDADAMKEVKYQAGTSRNGVTSSGPDFQSIFDLKTLDTRHAKKTPKAEESTKDGKLVEVKVEGNKILSSLARAEASPKIDAPRSPISRYTRKIEEVEEASKVENKGGVKSTRSNESNEPKSEPRGLEATQKEFLDIFNEMNRPLRARGIQDGGKVEGKPDEKLKIGKRNAEGTPKIDRRRNEGVKIDGRNEERQTIKKVEKRREARNDEESRTDARKEEFPRVVENESGTVQEFEKKEKKRPKTTLKTTEDPATTDLKEMLKEMKHSLPKRPKPKRSSSEDAGGPKSSSSSSSSIAESRMNFLSAVLTAHPPEIRVMNEPLLFRNDIKKDIKSDIKDVPLIPKSEPVPKSDSPVFRPEMKLIQGEPVVKDKTTLIKNQSSIKDDLALPKSDREDRQKVSSAVQTSGNVRRVNQGASTSWKLEDVLYTTGRKSQGAPGLVKNTFQLIRPRDFARIEAAKMSKDKKENTYANVMDQSLYANALVLPSKKDASNVIPSVERDKDLRDDKDNNSAKDVKEVPEAAKYIEAPSGRPEPVEDDEDHSTLQDMNTLAVNRLLKRLEAAIASGRHQQAAGLAKELARLKIHCSVIRQRFTNVKNIVNVNMYVEDKLAHQGPIPLLLQRNMTVAQLKNKVFAELEIPTSVQRWIIGNNLANDEATLEELQISEGAPVFVYLVAPDKVEEPQNEGAGGRALEVDQAPVAGVGKAPEEVEKPGDEHRHREEVPEEIEVPQRVLEEECTPEKSRMVEYEELMSLENCDVIPNSEEIECPVCFVTYGPREGVILRDCLHMFCRPCIANTILYCEEAEVKCPFRNTEYSCDSTLQEREIKALVSPEVYQQHLDKSIAQAENNAGNAAFHCKTPDCPGWCIYDDNVNNFLCPVCNVNNCLTCQAIHTGKNCREYQEELRYSKETDQESKMTAAMLEKMVDQGEALSCPTCAVVLMKKWGCDWLRCSMCRTEICWVTRGPRWGPGGRGDMSGGCRCGENGVKCHPRCNYCH
ncbi:uncharacterized protein LOC105697376 [Orussus abietinus]|uniref:uncharacterized protein LOC105697376 n=1 Tax=Orussus abietinus TaxID=222816 RepID=UPI0006255E1D|nr:uncharacterized protein LOC105697376 [Orussus abietinus]